MPKNISIRFFFFEKLFVQYFSMKIDVRIEAPFWEQADYGEVMLQGTLVDTNLRALEACRTEYDFMYPRIYRSQKRAKNEQKRGNKKISTKVLYRGIAADGKRISEHSLSFAEIVDCVCCLGLCAVVYVAKWAGLSVA